MKAKQVQAFLKRPGIHLPGIAREYHLTPDVLRNIRNGKTKTILNKHKATFRAMLSDYGENISVDF